MTVIRCLSWKTAPHRHGRWCGETWKMTRRVPGRWKAIRRPSYRPMCPGTVSQVADLATESVCTAFKDA